MVRRSASQVDYATVHQMCCGPLILSHRLVAPWPFLLQNVGLKHRRCSRSRPPRQLIPQLCWMVQVHDQGAHHFHFHNFLHALHVTADVLQVMVFGHDRYFIIFFFWNTYFGNKYRIGIQILNICPLFGRVTNRREDRNYFLKVKSGQRSIKWLPTLPRQSIRMRLKRRYESSNFSMTLWSAK